jgi:predicted amidohydrolase YtcJ
MSWLRNCRSGGGGSPIGPLSPYLGIAAAINRATSAGLVLNQAEALSSQEALEAYTCGAAYAMGHEGWRGRLAIGALADLAVLDRDILQCVPKDIADIKSRVTLVQGEIAYSDGTLLLWELKRPNGPPSEGQRQGERHEQASGERRTDQ